MTFLLARLVMNESSSIINTRAGNNQPKGYFLGKEDTKMFPASTHNGQSVTGFPDVCKIPLVTAGAVPVAYPIAGRVAIKPASAQQLRDRLNQLNQQLTSLGGQDATRWHALVDQYVMTTAQLFKLLQPGTATRKPTAIKPR